MKALLLTIIFARLDARYTGSRFASCYWDRPAVRREMVCRRAWARRMNRLNPVPARREPKKRRAA